MVLVLDKRKNPLMPCSEKRARLLLEKGRAVVTRVHPFTIRLKDRVGGDLQPMRLKIDPGYQTTGLALVREDPEKPAAQSVCWLAELTHRSESIRKAMRTRKAHRRSRRRRHSRYRQERFSNRGRSKGWLPPSLEHRVATTQSWITRIQKRAPLVGLTIEFPWFDMSRMAGQPYREGPLYQKELRPLLLERWGHRCSYCGATGRLEVEHLVSSSRLGTNRLSNLVVACRPCNEEKGALGLEAFFRGSPGLHERARRHGVDLVARLIKIQSQIEAGLRGASGINSTRWALFQSMRSASLPVEVSHGFVTHRSRKRLGIPKSHALDAACTGSVESLSGWRIPCMAIQSTGRGSYARTRLDRHGFPRLIFPRKKTVQGFQTGDLVKAAIPKGQHAGTHFGRVSVRSTGYFALHTARGKITSKHSFCALVQRADGYRYSIMSAHRDSKGRADRRQI